MKGKNIKQNLTDLLSPQSFKGESSTVIVDPPEPMLINLSLDEIDFSPLNPRTTENPRYAEIKASVLTLRRIKTTLTVTRHPGENIYRLSAGGNTRLRILKEVYEETGDESMARQLVLFEPYGSDSEDSSIDARILIDHMIENSLRSDNTFIEKAIAIRNTMELLVKERDINPDKMSDRKWIAIIADEYGYPISRELFIVYRYTLNHLLENIPIALNHGLGRPTIKRIQRLEKLYREYCATEPITDDQFILVFESTLAMCDGEILDMEHLESMLLDQFSQFLGESDPDAISLAISNIDQGKPADSKPNTTDDIEAEGDLNQTTDIADSTISSELDDNAGFVDIDNESPPKKARETATPNTLSMLSLRREALDSARLFAKAYGLDHLIEPTETKQGGYALFGFYVEYPEKQLQDDYQSACWWFLFHLSEFLITPGHDPFSVLKKDSLLGIMLNQFASEGEAVLYQKLSAIVGNPEGIESWIASMLTDPKTNTDGTSRLLKSIQSIKQNIGKEVE